jgi:beta-lactamase superfamily II metal-dependent hydrolase
VRAFFWSDVTMSRLLQWSIVVIFLSPAFVAAQNKSAKPVQIYVVDVEGGNATLFVSPSGESVLIDTGNPGVRDAGRILAATKDAGVTQIDHLITTHWHGDHFGGLSEVASRIPVKQFIDHGGDVQHNPQVGEFLKNVYPTLYKDRTHAVVKPGDKIPVAGLDWRIVSAGGELIKSPLLGAGKANPNCADVKPHDPDPGENAQSVGSVVTFGKFRIVHLGDLTWNKELSLMCPNNPLGTTDVLIVSHHGLSLSNSPALIHALHPRVALLNNGTRKGGAPEVMQVIYSSPGLEDLWQMHFSQLSGQEYTVPGMFIANLIDDQPLGMPIAPIPAPAPGPAAPPPPAHEGVAYWIKISAQSDGTFTVTNTRNEFSKTYAAQK